MVRLSSYCGRLALVVLCGAHSAGAATVDLYLEVLIDNRSTGKVAHVKQVDGDTLLARASDLRTLRVSVPSTVAPVRGIDAHDWVALDSLPGLAYRYESATQQLFLEVPAELRPVQHLGYEAPSHVEARRDWGAVVSYDAYGRRLGSTGTLGASGDLRWFGPIGAIETNGLVRAEGGQATAQRLDTRWTYSDPSRMWTWTAGDMISGSHTWTRPVRMAGVQWRRSFGVRPDLVTLPMPRFAGATTVPATVELYVDNVRHFTGQVQEGPFVLDALPRVNGLGQASVVVTDALGRVTQTVMPLYVDHQRLARGLTDFSVEAGVVRRGYASGRDAYGREVAGVGSIRHGLTNAVTAELHGEAHSRLAMGGAGLVWAPTPRVGLLAVSWAHSAHDNPGAGDTRGWTSGHQYTVGYQWTRQGFGVDAQTLRRTSTMRDLGNTLAESTRTGFSVLSQQRATAWVRAGRGSISGTWLRARRDDGTRVTTRSATWTHTLASRVSVSASLFDDTQGGVGGGVSMTVPLGRQAYASVSVNHGENGTTVAPAWRRPAPYAGGWGWTVQGSDAGSGTAQASLETRGRLGAVQAGVERLGGSQGGFVQASGSLVMMGGQLLPSRRVGESFAVVSSGRKSNVQVLNEHRAFGRTNGRGYLVVPDLRAWQRNRIGIDPSDLAASVRVGRLEQMATPVDGAGVFVRFDVAEVTPAIAQLLGPDGDVVPAGTRARIGGSGDTRLVGFDGEVFLDDLSSSIVLETATCRYRVSAPSGATGTPVRIGPVRCESR